VWYQKITHGVEVSVRPLYRRKDSSPKENLYVWTYEIRVSNLRDLPVQLLSRYWHITDADGNTQKVHGPGVVGERPVIEPNQTFEYSSFTHLTTSFGNMSGHYQMVSTDGKSFDVVIPRFPLSLPVRLVDDVTAPTPLETSLQ
jgi:ApaG protein